MKKELSKKENVFLSTVVILQKIISNEKLVIPRLKVFEDICPDNVNWFEFNDNNIINNI